MRSTRFVRKRTAGPTDFPFVDHLSRAAAPVAGPRLSSAVLVAVPVTGLAVEGGGVLVRDSSVAAGPFLQADSPGQHGIAATDA